MLKRPRVSVVVLVLAAAGIVAVTGARAHPVEGSLRNVDRATGNFSFVEHAVSDTVVDIGPKGDSRGDLLAFGNPVYSADDKTPVGRDQGSCIRTVPGKAWECEWTLTLPRGSLVVQGPYYDSRDSVLAVTGGTGIWAHARGEMGLHARDAKGTAYDFRYHVTQ